MANKNLSATITIGGIVGSSLKAAFGAAEKGVNQIGEKVRQLTARQKELNNVIRQQEQLGRTGSALKVQYAQKELAALDKQIAKLKRITELEKLRQANAAKTAEARSRTIGATVGLTVAALPVIGAIKQAASIESAAMGVAKQLEGARDANGKLTQEFFNMRNEIMEKARELPIETSELFGMYEAGLKQGIDKGVVGKFVDSVSQISVALELSREETAQQMGVISNLYKRPIESIGELGDSINYLDDKYLSTAGGIINYMTRIGGTAASFGVADKQAAALGSTFQTLGTNIEEAATSTRAMFTNLGAADKIKKVGKGLSALGLSAKNVQLGMTRDSVGTFLTVLDGINALPKEKQTGVLYELFGKEHIGNAQKLAQNVDMLREQLNAAYSGEAKGSALREFQAQLGTTNAQVILAQNRVSELSVNIGESLLPPLKSTLEVINPVVTVVGDFARENPKLTKTIIGVVGGMLALNVATKAATWGWLGVAGKVIKYKEILTTLPPALGRVGTAMRLLKAVFLMNPVGIAIAGIAVGAALIISNWDKLGPFFEHLWKGITYIFTTSYDFIVGRIEALLGWLREAGDAMSTVFGGDAAGIDPQMYIQRQLPEVAPVGARTSQVIHDNSQQTIQIYQQPGQDPKAIADEVERRQKRRAGVSARSAFADGAGL